MVDSKTFAKNSESSGYVGGGGFEGNGDTPLNRLQERNCFREGGSSAIVTIEMCGRPTFGVMLGIYWRSNVGAQ